MVITLSFNHSEVNKFAKQLTPLESLTGTLRAGTSIIDPVIEVTGLQSATIAQCNYAYIPEFNRKYFVNNIKSAGEDRWVLSMHVDVLSTYHDQIATQKAVIKRQENKWNLYLDDGIFKTYSNPIVSTVAFPAGFSQQNFILAVAGG